MATQTDRVIVEIVTAANTTGIKEAQAGFLGMTNALTAALAGMGLLVVAGKSAIDIAEKQEKAQSDLAQAVDEYNAQYGKAVTSGAASAETLAKLTDAQKTAQDAVTVAYNHAQLALVAHTDAVKKHGKSSEEAWKANLALENANIALRHAQDALTDSTQQLNAAQAQTGTTTTHGIILMDNLQRDINSFIQTNRAYISSQAEVTDAYATLIRSGLDVNEVEKDMNRALDLAAIKHISLSEAVRLVDAAEHGRVKALVDLGITSKKYVDSSGNVVDANNNMAKVMAELDEKTAHGRDTTTQMAQASNKLGNDWQDIANVAGPPLLGMIEGIFGAADSLIQKLDWLGHNQDWNNALSAGFGNAQLVAEALRLTFDAVVADIKWVLDNAGKAANFVGGLGGNSSAGSPANLAHRRAASGFDGTVSSPTLFLAGEAGTEDVHITPMGGGGGRGGSPIHIHIEGYYSDGPGLDKLANAIARRLTYTTGR